REQRVEVRDDARLLHPVGRYVLALKIGDRLDRRVLAYPERHLEAIQGHRHAQVRLGVAFPDVLAPLRFGRLADVEEQEVRLARIDRIEDRRVAAETE